MTAAANLDQAAALAADNYYALWTADTLKTAVTTFAADAPMNALFLNAATNDQPIINWIAVVAAQATQILPFVQVTVSGKPYGIGTLATMSQAVDYMYRLCKLAYAMQQAGLITSGQAAAILTAYNTNFA